MVLPFVAFGCATSIEARCIKTSKRLSQISNFVSRMVTFFAVGADGPKSYKTPWLWAKAFNHVLALPKLGLFSNQLTSMRVGGGNK